jgi:hypothetical protein
MGFLPGTSSAPLASTPSSVTTVGPVCRSPKRRQMEFTNKKNRDLREKVKQIVQISDAAALDDAAGLRTTAERVILLREIKQLALDVLVEL